MTATAPRQPAPATLPLHPRRILLATPWYPNPSHPIRGIFCRDNAEALRRAGHSVRIVHVSPEATDPSQLPVRRAWYPATRRAALPLGLARAAAAIAAEVLAWRPDVLHAHVLIPVGVAAALVGRLLGVPVVLTEHMGPFEAQLGSGLRRRVARLALARVGAVVAVSRAQAAQIEPFVGRDVPVEVIPNAVDFDVFARRLQPRPGRDRVVCVGRLSSEKRHDDLLAAFAQLRRRRPTATLTLVGDGPLRADVEAAAQRLGVADAVTLRGLLPRAAVVAELAAADLKVLPSAHENNPCALLEALAAGRPVVSTAWHGADEIVSPSVGALSPLHHPDALADALDATLARPFDPATISAYAESRWSYTALAQRLDALYDRVTTSAKT